jgi:uncharacterized phiE125 gp8 family phage protein
MTVNLVSITGAEPDTLDDIKNFLRVDHTDEDILINSLMITARESSEQFLQRSIVEKQYELILDEFKQEIKIPLPPLKSVDSITYQNENNETVTFTDYEVDTNSRIGKVHIKSFPNENLYFSGAVKVTFTAGYATVAEPMKQAIKLFVSHYYENREMVVTTGAQVAKMPFSAEALLYPYRVWL